MATIKAIFSFLQVLAFVVGIIPVDANISYSNTEYQPPQINTPMYLVEDGKSEFVIVTADDADECILTAVNEMQTYISKISGANLEHITESEYIEGTKSIIIGETEIENNVTTVDRTQIGADGFMLYSDGTNLLIAGGDSRGTLYGVYTLLEEYLGVRWFTPTLEVIPESKDVVIDAALNRIVKPSFSIRRNSPSGADDAYRAKHKTNVSFHYEANEYGGALNYVLWDVTFDKLIPDSLYAEHPEYFAMNPDGTRTTDHVCVTHPDVLPIAVENARKAILECERDSRYIHIGQKDNSNYCHCENCEALYEKYGSISAPTIIFTNAFADALDDEFPDFTFTFYAYGETERPPQDLSLRCNSNVIPVLCGLHKACRSHLLTECGAQDGDESLMNLYGDTEPTIAEDFKVWTEIADRTYIYDYTINFLYSAQFFSNIEYMQETMEYMYDIGITGYIYNCGDGHYASFNDLRNYLLCKLQWDVNADVEYHIIDFMTEYYGAEAAPYIKEILDLYSAGTKATAHAFDFDWHYQAGYYSLSTMQRIEKLWSQALEADVTDEQLFRIEKENLSWEFFKANQMQGDYFFFNPLRMQKQEWLYDELKAHGIDRVSSFWLLPAKEEIDFIKRPYNWEK